ncbi:hypothetical protein RBU60_10170 [Mesonia sp. MT50]|uniref:Lipoprotein n=1 Tax=Mesonia profundi TaxID=3070998 RepID=A0ABU1A2M6_9FLAO|nr:hypothetical protein [Mesonia profundi]MDQ7917941.1 hypothetical protein [Mesonia profundi]
MFKTKRLMILLGIFGFLLVGCKDNSKTENAADDASLSRTKNDTDNTSSSKTKKKTGAYATITFDDGRRTIEMEARSQQGILSLPTKFEGNMTDYKIIVIIELKDSEPLQNKIYEKGAYLSISNMKGKIPLDEKYQSNHNKSEDGKRGHAEIKITSISKTHAEGTFTGTLYSKSHRKATIEGKFITKRKKE